MATIKRKVSLRTKLEESQSVETPPKKSSHLKLILLLLIVLLFLIVLYFLFFKEHNAQGVQDNMDEVKTEQVMNDHSNNAGNTLTSASSLEDKHCVETNTQNSEIVPSNNSKASHSSSEELKSHVVNSDVDVVAKEVIRGMYGNGVVRRKNLGVRYHEIQNRVNEMYRKGLL